MLVLLKFNLTKVDPDGVSSSSLADAVTMFNVIYVKDAKDVKD